MFPIVCQKTSMRDAFFYVLNYGQKNGNVQSFYQQNSRKYTQKQYHRLSANCFLIFILQVRVTNSLKHLIYNINITNAFSMFKSKIGLNFIFSGTWARKNYMQIQQPKCNAPCQLETYLILFLGLILCSMSFSEKTVPSGHKGL